MAVIFQRPLVTPADIAQQIHAFMTNGFAAGSIVYLDGGGVIG
jgi:hypothetical protein